MLLFPWFTAGGGAALFGVGGCMISEHRDMLVFFSLAYLRRDRFVEFDVRHTKSAQLGSFKNNRKRVGAVEFSESCAEFLG
jgi:hypothetical protein